MKYRCNVCNVYEYDDAIGDVHTKIKPGTKPEDFPDSWECPICGADKSHLQPIEEDAIEEKVDIRVYAEHVEVWYGQGKVDDLPRLRGRDKSRIEYRHVIDWLVRKPGTFENYRYREEMFPTSQSMTCRYSIRLLPRPRKRGKSSTFP